MSCGQSVHTCRCVDTKVTKLSDYYKMDHYFILLWFSFSLLFKFNFVLWVLIETESVPDILMLPVPGTVASSILLQKIICDWMEEWRKLAHEDCDIAEGNPEYPSPKVACLPYFFIWPQLSILNTDPQNSIPVIFCGKSWEWKGSNSMNIQ